MLEYGVATESKEVSTNMARISGYITQKLQYSHAHEKITFYKTQVRVKRKSTNYDLIPLIIPNELIGDELKGEIIGKCVEVKGQIRSHNRNGEDGRRHTDVFLFAKSIEILQDEEEERKSEDENTIYLDGYICKEPIYRITPLGKEISDFILAVNRNYGKADYIPCIAWGTIAKEVSKMPAGSRIQLEGRIQSRKYFKRYSTDSTGGEYKTAYEVSIMSMKVVM